MKQNTNIIQREDQYSLSTKEFSFICKLVYEKTGIVLDERKREMVYRRLMRRTRELKLASFKDYCQLIKQEKSDEIPRFINAITTNLTSFFRENHHFDYLKNIYLPSIIEHQRRDTDEKKIRIWSSACSTGEEAYSIAITLHETLGSLMNQFDIKILATDLDTNVIDTAKQGIYSIDRIKDLDDTIKKRWFYRSSTNKHSHVKVKSQLQDIITFKPLNLLHDWPMKNKFDVIFCRNVLIYFDKETQQYLISRFSKQLQSEGVLFLGHSESIDRANSQLQFVGKTTFIN